MTVRTVRPALLVATLFAIAACRGRASDDTLTPHAFPGFEVPLPDWHVEKEDLTWSTGEYLVRDGRNVALVRWSPASEAVSDADVRAVLDMFGQVQISEPMGRATVSGHPGTAISFSISGFSGQLVAWFCPERQREHLLFLTGSAALISRVVAGTRCHTTPAPVGESASGVIYPRFDPPPGATPQDAAAGLKLWVSDNAVYFAMLGQVGDVTRAGRLADSNRLIDALFGMMSLGDISDRSTSNVVDAQGRSRLVVHARGRLDDTALDLTVMMWFCADSNRSYVVAYGCDPADADGSGATKLLRFDCPAPTPTP